MTARLTALAERAGRASAEVERALGALSRGLLRGDAAGWPEAEGILAEIVALGAAELSLLAASCRGSRLRAAAAASAVIEAFIGACLPATSAPSAPARVTLRPDRRAPAATLSPSEGGRWGDAKIIGEGFERSSRAAELAEELRGLAPWVGWHTRGSVIEGALVERLGELSALIERSPELHEIAAELGRIEAPARAERGGERGGRQTVVGVRAGGELADILPSELALLGDPLTEDLFYARLGERRLLSLELSGDMGPSARRERRAGPVIACVDTSGSMRGPAEALAKAALLAVARLVLGAGRPMVVMIFGGRGAITELNLRPGRVDLGALLALLLTSYYGGTDLDGPLARALTLRETAPFRRADLLVISDGIARLGERVVGRVQAARERQDLRVVSVIIGGRGELLAPVSDRLWLLGGEAGGSSGLRGWA